jgi:hypothetical protein
MHALNSNTGVKKGSADEANCYTDPGVSSTDLSIAIHGKRHALSSDSDFADKSPPGLTA